MYLSIRTFPEHLLGSWHTRDEEANQTSRNACCQEGAMTDKCNIYWDAVG